MPCIFVYNFNLCRPTLPDCFIIHLRILLPYLVLPMNFMHYIKWIYKYCHIRVHFPSHDISENSSGHVEHKSSGMWSVCWMSLCQHSTVSKCLLEVTTFLSYSVYNTASHPRGLWKPKNSQLHCYYIILKWYIFFKQWTVLTCTTLFQTCFPMVFL